MSFLKKLFGRKQNPPPPKPPATPPPLDPSQDPNLIRVYDGYGRELFITRQHWRDNVLLGNLKKAWDQPDDLYNLIVGALHDGFRADVVDAARRLHQIDPIPSRSACIWGIVLMEEGRLDEAEKVFRDHTARHGEEGVIFTNLAKVYSKRKNDAKSEAILWHALELDPNQDNGLIWYEAIHRERGGDAAGQEALRRIAALPGSWRAQLWLARAALQARDLQKAVALQQESLSRAPRPVPADLLMQISGDLGNAGHLPEILQLVAPRFDPATHGLQVGNNLIKAHLDLGQIDPARLLVEQLYALQRPDWREALSFWDTEIAKARLLPAAAPGDPAADPATPAPPPLQIAMLTIQGPVWLRPDSPATELFPFLAPPPESAATANAAPGRLAFLGSSAEVASTSQVVQHQMADARGRLSRALPLFLAEQAAFGLAAARVQTLVPWIASGTPGFVLGSAPWADTQAADSARQGETPSDYVIISYLKTSQATSPTDPWAAELRLIRTLDGQCLAELRAEFPADQPQQALPDLAHRLLDRLAAETGSRRSTPPPASSLYRLPPPAQLPYYLLRLEQLLAVRCSAMDSVPSGFLSGEREIIQGNIQLCLDCPDQVPVRLLLAQTLLTMKRVRPDILPEFREKLAKLQKENPLPGPAAQAVIQRLLDEALTP